MKIEDYINIVTYLSLGSATVVLVALSTWPGRLWAKRILQNEINEHFEKLASIQKSLDFLNKKDVTRHNNKLLHAENYSLRSQFSGESGVSYRKY
jgi:hypothetical protein